MAADMDPRAGQPAPEGARTDGAVADNSFDAVGLAAREVEYTAFVEANLKRNYIANFAHGMLGMTGFRLIAAPTFVPTYLFMITGSTALVGLGQAMQQLGSVLSPIIGAAQVEHRDRVMPIAVKIGMGMRVPLLLLAIAGWLMSGMPLFIVTAVLLFFFGFFSGSQRVVFQMLMAKVIPIAKRGKLQAWRNFAGGGIAAILSYFAGSWFIQQNVFGNGYSTVFLLSFVLTALGLFVLQRFMNEPIPPTVRPRMALRDRLRELPLLFHDRDYRHFVMAQGMAIAGRMSMPFAILYVGQSRSIDGKTLGLLSLAFLGADTISNLWWGAIGDRKGFKLTFVLALMIWIAALVLLIEGQGLAVMIAVFAGLGAAQSGYMMSVSTMVLEFGSRDDIPMRLALSTTTETAIASVGPLAGGVIAATLGYLALFWVSIGFLVASLAMIVFAVREPRYREPLPIDSFD